jgi:hypothetical protein
MHYVKDNELLPLIEGDQIYAAQLVESEEEAASGVLFTVGQLVT